MNNIQAYNNWAESYDDVTNKTRDLEATAIRKVLGRKKFRKILELGCGTGKNTEWLLTRDGDITAVDFSGEMLAKAKEKITSEKVNFVKGNIKKKWKTTRPKYDLLTCSLILEHIKDLDFIFKQAYRVLRMGGLFYIGELHPQKQYVGSKARFEKEKKTVVLDCFTHNISDFTGSAIKNRFKCLEIRDWYDEDDKTVPRLITMVFRRLM
ncbi:MAG: class I SAM-dependent methyltransferase [Ignavibacteriae bacterium]|nr:class I SAM-dependent methyltransferase [Ignavibacteriota bacterium]